MAKNFYNPSQLVLQSWFPFKHPLTVIRHIQRGQLKAKLVVGVGKNGNRWVIHRQDLLEYGKTYNFTIPDV